MRALSQWTTLLASIAFASAVPNCVIKQIQNTMTLDLPQGFLTIHSGTCDFVNETSNMVETLDAAGTDLNVCGEPCNTYCFEESHDAPDKSDCDFLAQLLAGEELIDYIRVQPGSNSLSLWWGTCVTLYATQYYTGSTPCRADWSTQIGQVMSKCQPAKNTNGGVCMASDSSGYYISVQKTYASIQG